MIELMKVQRQDFDHRGASIVTGGASCMILTLNGQMLMADEGLTVSVGLRPLAPRWLRA